MTDAQLDHIDGVAKKPVSPERQGLEDANLARAARQLLPQLTAEIRRLREKAAAKPAKKKGKR